MNNIRDMMVENSVLLYALMKNLILHFCVIINVIFFIIKAKLLYFLIHLELQIYVDYALLIKDVESLKVLLSKLQLLISRYKLILEMVKGLLKEFNKLLPNILRNFSSIFSAFYKIVKILICKLKSICTSCNNLNAIFGLLNKELSSVEFNRHGSSINIKVTSKDKSKRKVTASITNIDLSKITNIHNLYKYLKKLLQGNDILVSAGIMSIVGQLYIIDQINLRKLHRLIKQIDNLYLNVIIRAYLLVCTIKFYNQIKQNITEMSESLKFECCNCQEFLSSCSSLEKNCLCISDKIEDCITKLATACNKCKGCLGVPKQLKELFIKLIEVVLILKFYVDLMAMEILIFKMIIMTLVQMTVSSVIVDFLRSQITSIEKVDDAIPRLMAVNVWLRAFYVIQLQNTMTIFALSSKLMLSQSIHHQYRVLLFNLQSIQILIWGIKCYIQHLFVFSYVTKGLNSQIDNIGGLLQIVIDIYKVIGSLATITNKLRSIDKSIKQLKDIKEDIDITKWKEKSKGIRDQIKLVKRDIGEINSQINLINGYLGSIYESWAKLLVIYYYLLLLMDYVYQEIEKTKGKILGTGIENRYYRGVILSVLGPCNKQLMYIFKYLGYMWVYVDNLIKIVQYSIGLIIVKTEWLNVLTSKLKKDVDTIDRGVVKVECAIEGVARNFIRCSLQSLSNHLIKIQDINQNIDIIHINIKIYVVNNNLINNNKHYI